jgi:hypothetical protein
VLSPLAFVGPALSGSGGAHAETLVLRENPRALFRGEEWESNRRAKDAPAVEIGDGLGGIGHGAEQPGSVKAVKVCSVALKLIENCGEETVVREWTGVFVSVRLPPGTDPRASDWGRESLIPRKSLPPRKRRDKTQRRVRYQSVSTRVTFTRNGGAP